MERNLFSQTFWDHLDELRSRLIKSIGAVVVTSCIFYNYAGQTLDYLIRPVGQIYFTSPAEAFSARLIVTIIGGILLALPILVYQIWKFVGLALTANERKHIVFFAPLSLVFFLFGILFAHFVAIPTAIQFLMGFASDAVVPMITVKNYISFIGTMLLAFGVIFELPLILMFLTKIGIATPEFLRQKRKHAIVLNLIVSAILTPPDIISQLIMAAPLFVLYEVGILVSQWVYRSKI
jgi:sec-independent protein translocase protein TatC